MKHRFHSFIFPVWTIENTRLVFVCAFISFLGGVGGALLLHFKMKTIGTAAWHVGLIALLVYFSYYLKGVY